MGIPVKRHLRVKSNKWESSFALWETWSFCVWKVYSLASWSFHFHFISPSLLEPTPSCKHIIKELLWITQGHKTCHYLKTGRGWLTVLDADRAEKQYTSQDKKKKNAQWDIWSWSCNCGALIDQKEMTLQPLREVINHFSDTKNVTKLRVKGFRMSLLYK